jgi:LPXTG-site transpeptidase (sortase) family protein
VPVGLPSPETSLRWVWALWLYSWPVPQWSQPSDAAAEPDGSARISQTTKLARMSEVDHPPAETRRQLRNNRRVARRWWVAAGVLLLIGAWSLTVGQLDQQNTPPTPAATPQLASPRSVVHRSPPWASSSATRPAKPSVALVRAVPVALRIPAIGVSVSLGTLGLNPDRTVQVPTKYQQPGWFRLGPSPGEVGSAVILGHVDDFKGPAAFFRLGALKMGDKVEVSLANGVLANFKVTTVAIYPKTQFPASQVYASHGYSALQLVTCGGAFDTRTGHYLSNVVAYTTLVSTTTAAAAAANAG